MQKQFINSFYKLNLSYSNSEYNSLVILCEKIIYIPGLFCVWPDVTYISLYQTNIPILHRNQMNQIESKTNTCSSSRHVFYICLLEPWFDMYLKSRLPIVLNYNPFISFQDDPRPEYQNQVSNLDTCPCELSSL